jgi:hypothetical protein
MNDYDLFYDSFISDVRLFSKGEVLNSEGDGRQPDFLENAFTEVFLGYLDERGIADGSVTCYHAAKTTKGHIKINAWGMDDEDGLLSLSITHFSNDFKNHRLTNTEIDTVVKQVVRAFEMAISGYHERMEQSTEAYEMMKCIYESQHSFVNIEFILLTNGLLPKNFKLPKVKEGAYSYHFDIWDLVRLHKVISSDTPYESITIDLYERFGIGIPCLPITSSATDYKVRLAVIPGFILCDLYEEYGHKLLDLNVRSFLQARGKVNKGIRDTLCNEPSRFLAYNNGITATVEKLDMIINEDNQHIIKSITGFQVVNGGQTMASIHRSFKIDKANISEVYVQAKITEVEPESIPVLAPLISRFANSQNKVSDADFSSNDPIHVEMQRLSEKVWIPGEQSRWYYERTRGQFQVEKNRKAPTAARAKKYDLEHPSNQRFNKTDFAKYMYSWDQLPQVVSLGAQKCFVNFMADLKQTKDKDWQPDEVFYKEVIAKAIIFKSADKVARKNKIPSYKANVVTYMVAYLSKKSLGRMSLMDIWDNQKVHPSVLEAFNIWVMPIHDELVKSAKGRNVTEWCKKDQCWDVIQEIDFGMPHGLQELLESNQPLPTVGKTKHIKRPSLSSLAKENLARTMQLDDKTWFEISRWGKKTRKLNDWQCKFILTLVEYAQSNWATVPSDKQAAQAVKIIDTAIEYNMPGLSNKKQTYD